MLVQDKRIALGIIFNFNRITKNQGIVTLVINDNIAVLAINKIALFICLRLDCREMIILGWPLS